ncbi:TOMM precursor leader peptide-binding protein [Sphaerisporangium sp. B11E5]|uniref:TOMM precursor leader peptide-binding protein n=1 Tax=Sphaerisporangium sp. B11E5 TaxID=3153563 RepID=UPI00325E80B0
MNQRTNVTGAVRRHHPADRHPAVQAGTRRIGFKRHLRPEIAGEAVYLLSERGTTALSGRPAQVLAPLLDGSHSEEELYRAASAHLPQWQIDEVLGRMNEAGLIGYRTDVPAADTGAEAYWDLAGLDGDRITGTLPTALLGVVALDTDPAPVMAACHDAGLHAVLTGQDADEAEADLTLVLCDDYLDTGLERVNAARLAGGRPWLLAKPGGADVWIGPVFRPGDGPCWECLAQRLRGHRRAEICLRRTAGDAAPPEASLPLTRGIGALSVALEAAKWLAGHRYEGQDSIWTLDTLTLAGRRHPLRRRPQCPSCGDPELIARQVREPVTVTSRPKTAGGTGERAMTPDEVWKRYSGLADPVTGVTAAIRRDPRGPAFLHGYLAGPNLALGAGDLAQMRAGLRAQSGGKGVTDLEARVSALCEAVERYSGVRAGDEPVVRDSFRGLGDAAVHPDSCQLFHPRQYAGRDAWNAVNSGFHHVPEPFDDRQVIEWTPVWSLTAGHHRLLPTDLLYYRPSGAPGTASVRADSNGNAAGSSREDAIVQGFLELTERDAVALWWYNRTRHRAVDLDSAGDPWVAGIRERYAALGREVWVLDITSDLGVPVMAAVSRRTGGPAEDIMLGFGAHFDPRIALRRALAELGQLLPVTLAGGPDGTGYGTTDPALLAWWTGATVRDQPYLLPDGATPAVAVGDMPWTPRADLADDVRHIVELARGNGLEVLVLDQTRPDIGLPVVKVVVPGLRHFWARFAPGRLYDVPVRLGRLAEPTAYENLNPVPLFL